jgi:hypothetical protein
LFALPMMLLTSSVAVLFETLPVLRGGVGNVVYFFAWTAVLALGATGLDDPSGMQLLYRSARSTLQAIDPTSPENFHFSLTIGGDQAVRTFPWEGIDWTVNMIMMRLLWIGVAVGFALMAALFFHRFDPARSWRRKGAQADITVRGAFAPDQRPASATDWLPITAAHLTPLVRTAGGSRFAQLVTSEVRLMLKGQRWWWYAGAAGCMVGQFVSPDASLRGGFLLAAWIWPILLWSQMGCREARHATGALLFSSERSLSRQLPALWTAGVLVSLMAGAGVGIRYLFGADWHSFAAWLAGAAFIPSFALALGIWSGSSKAFEAIYTVWWYIGPGHQMPGLDFMGTTPASSTPATYAVAAAALLAVSYWGRRARLGYA